MIKIIVATDPNRVIGIDNKIPWNYPSDFARFKQITHNGTLILGSTTWSSIPGTLPNRNIIVVSSRPAKEVIGDRKNMSVGRMEQLLSRFEVVSSIEKAVERAKANHNQIWCVGGSNIYNQMMHLVGEIDLTLVPEVEIKLTAEPITIVYFPKIDESKFALVSTTINPADERLKHQIYRRI